MSGLLDSVSPDSSVVLPDLAELPEVLLGAFRVSGAGVVSGVRALRGIGLRGRLARD